MMKKYRVILKTNLRRVEFVVSAENPDEAEEEFIDNYNESFMEEETDEKGFPKYNLKIIEIKQ